MVVMLYVGQSWHLLWNSGCWLDLQAVCSFLTPFLTETICEKVVQWGQWYAQPTVELGFPKRHSSSSLAGEEKLLEVDGGWHGGWMVVLQKVGAASCRSIKIVQMSILKSAPTQLTTKLPRQVVEERRMNLSTAAEEQTNKQYQSITYLDQSQHYL